MLSGSPQTRLSRRTRRLVRLMKICERPPVTWREFIRFVLAWLFWKIWYM